MRAARPRARPPKFLREGPEQSRPLAWNSVPPSEAHQRAEHVIEPPPQLRLDLRNIPERGGDFEASEHLAERTERGVIASGPILPAVVGSFGDVERRTRQSTPALTSQVRVTPLELTEKRPQRANEVEQNGIDA